MVRIPWTTYLWPGLPQLWYGSLWWGLALAVGFAVLLNGLLLASLVWVELFEPLELRRAWLAAGGLWFVLVVLSAALGPGRRARRAAWSEAMFREALHEYLRGNWIETEGTLQRLLDACPGDVEARLLLATLLRRTQRHRAAREQLDRLRLWRDAERWALEIAAEQDLLAQVEAPADSAEPGAGETDPAEPGSATDTPAPAAAPRAA